jgi:capsular exopolysaccharide synthesis family protein
MLQLDKAITSLSNGKATLSERPSPAETAKAFLSFVRRQLPIIVFFALLSAGVGVAYLLVTPPMYTAQTSMIIDTHKFQIFRKLEQSSTSGMNMIDSGMVDSEVEMLKSDNVILAVIKRFDLANDPEFTGRAGGLIQALIRPIANLLLSHQEPQTEYERTRRAAAVFANRLTVKRLGQSYVIQVSFVSLDPKRAADIANAVANEYIVDQLQGKFQAARQAGGWLRDRLHELREQVAAAERAVIEFKIDKSLVSTGGADKRLVHEQQVAELNSQLVIARAQVSEANARLERIQAVLRREPVGSTSDGTVDATVTDTLKNEVITKLRSQYLTLAEREADWSKRYGSNHLAVVNLRNQMNEIKHSILDEVQQIAQTYKSDFEIAKQREAGLEQQLAQAVTHSQVADRAQVQLAELESNAQSYRALYDDFLQRYTESVQAQSWPITDTRVVTPAAQPLTKSYPQTMLVLLISVAGGFLLGLLIGHLRDLTDRVFRTRDQVEELLGLDCLATVPNIKPDKSKGGVSLARKVKAPVAGYRPPRMLTLPPAPNLGAGEGNDDEATKSDEPEGAKDEWSSSSTMETAGVNDHLSSSEFAGNEAGDSALQGDRSSLGIMANKANSENHDERFRLSVWRPFLGRGEDDKQPLAASVETDGLFQGRRPEATTLDEDHGERIIARRDPLMWQVVDFPLSPYTESIRSIKLAIDLLRAKVPKKARRPKKIIGITSTSPSEGKSTIAASLAQLIAHSDKQVILIDCDLRAPRLTRTLAPHARSGLLEVLSGDAALNDVIWTDKSKRLSFLPAVATARIPHTAEIIAADEMRALLDRLRGAYDYIIVDLTPLVPIVDVRASQGLVDHYIFVVEWGRTRIDLVQRSLKEVAGIYSNIFGVVLNKVGSGELKRYEGYGGYDYGQYYRRGDKR